MSIVSVLSEISIIFSVYVLVLRPPILVLTDRMVSNELKIHIPPNIVSLRCHPAEISNGKKVNHAYSNPKLDELK